MDFLKTCCGYSPLKYYVIQVQFQGQSVKHILLPWPRPEYCILYSKYVEHKDNICSQWVLLSSECIHTALLYTLSLYSSTVITFMLCVISWCIAILWNSLNGISCFLVGSGGRKNNPVPAKLLVLPRRCTKGSDYEMEDDITKVCIYAACFSITILHITNVVVRYYTTSGIFLMFLCNSFPAKKEKS